ncbi:sensor histidine kinase [Nonomuraea endophytica]|uniref:histidine kinase n=1 Tax=Nonomuraea endophytica TaxID=714136 RepID=A0A7W8EN63_9ACTN|nr:ATP-binding protein [Nonomuraea endophytica]MBB5084747.1 signal transduction histidine kinase [Nonomuraea endophytica]
MTARFRLAALYTLLVLAAGVVLTGLTYFLMSRNLGRRLSLDVVGTSADPGYAAMARQRLWTIAGRLEAATFSEFLNQALISLAVVTGLAAALGWFVAGRVLRPIRTISGTARRLSAENLSERVPVTTPADELATLARTINGMLDRIQTGLAERDQALDSQRMFTANAAHELRTPLATMRTAIDVTLDDRPGTAELLAMTHDVSAAVDQSRRILDGLLTLAHTQSGRITGRDVDLAEVATGVLAGVAGESRDIAVRRELRPARMTGDPVLLERMIGNLIDNAVHYNHAGGRVEVVTGVEGGQPFARVSNTGPPLTPDQVERWREPFVRGEGVRTRGDAGLGLGLSIVYGIAAAQDGSISTTARPAGGLDVTVRFQVEQVRGARRRDE